MSGYQSRYIAYARAHGKTPEQMSAEEKDNSNFIFWINEKWRQFDRLHPELYGRHDQDWVHIQFDDMLNRGAL